MKKALSLLLALTMVFALAACATTSDPGTTSATKPADTKSTTPAADTKPADTTPAASTEGKVALDAKNAISVEGEVSAAENVDLMATDGNVKVTKAITSTDESVTIQAGHDVDVKDVYVGIASDIDSLSPDGAVLTVDEHD